MTKTNSRIIKYRVWLKKEKRFTKAVRMSGHGIVYLPNGKELKKNQYILSQFTGLFDKNKIPLYEGDIVYFKKGLLNKYYPWTSNLESECIIEWCESGSSGSFTGCGSAFVKGILKGNIYEL